MTNQQDGRSPADAGSGSQASPAAPSGSAPTVSIPNAFERGVTFTPSFDKRDPAPSKNYGIGAVRIRFVLKGALGAVQWLIGTEWYVPSARAHLTNFPVFDMDGMRRPMGWDLGYHSPTPMYDGQSPMGECDVLGVECYYDGSSLNADLLVEGFLAEGDAYVWRALEAYYHCTFEDGPWPFNDAGNLRASGIEAATADETRSGSAVGESPAAESRDAQGQSA